MMITVKQASKQLGISIQRVHALMRSGKLKGKRIGFFWVVDSKQVEERAKQVNAVIDSIKEQVKESSNK